MKTCFPHITMQGCLNGVMLVNYQDKVVYAGFKRTMTQIDKSENMVHWSNANVLGIPKT